MSAAAVGQADVAELYRRHAGSLRNGLIGYGLTAQDAEDVVQETFTRALRTSSPLRDPKAAYAYLTTTARRIAWRMISARRENAVAPQSLPPLADPDPVVTADEGLDAAELLEHLAGAAGRAVAGVVVDLAAGASPGDLSLSPGRVRRARAQAAAALTGTVWARRRPLSIGVAPDRATPEIREQIERLPFRQREVLTRHLYAGMTPAQIAWHLGITANSVRVSLHAARAALGRRLRLDRDELTMALTAGMHIPDTCTTIVLPGPGCTAGTVTRLDRDALHSRMRGVLWPAGPSTHDSAYRRPVTLYRPRPLPRLTRTGARSA